MLLFFSKAIKENNDQLKPLFLYFKNNLFKLCLYTFKSLSCPEVLLINIFLSILFLYIRNKICFPENLSKTK